MFTAYVYNADEEEVMMSKHSSIEEAIDFLEDRTAFAFNNYGAGCTYQIFDPNDTLVLPAFGDQDVERLFEMEDSLEDLQHNDHVLIQERLYRIKVDEDGRASLTW